MHHPIVAASRGDIVAGENRDAWRATAAVYDITLMKSSFVQQLPNTSCYSGETLRSSFPDQAMTPLWCRFSLGSIVCGVALDVETEGGDVQSFSSDWCYAQ
jgi:hypothetical protein